MSNKTKNGDLPINPSIGVLSQQQEHGATQVGNGDTLQFHGLTKREYFAAMAMQGMLAGGVNILEPKHYSQHAINWAEQLLKQLDR